MKRSRHIDVLRGIAILGILPANIPYFAWPLATVEGGIPAAAAIGEQIAIHATRFAVDYKFISIFSLLFGVGIVVMRRSAEAAGHSFAGRMLRRFAVLGVVGVAHGLLLWPGDILFSYAVGGLVLFLLAGLGARALAWIGGSLFAIPVLFMGGLVLLLTVLSVSGVEEYAEFETWFCRELRGLGSLTVDDARALVHGDFDEFFAKIWSFEPPLETVVYREGSFGHGLAMRFAVWVVAVVFIAFYFSWRIGGLFLIGMALAKCDWFLRSDHPDARARFGALVKWGLLLGLPVQILANVLLASQGGSIAIYAGTELAQYTGSLGLAFAYVGAIGWLFAQREPGRWARPFEAVGRTALSCYLLESLILFGVFQRWGLGLFGTMSRVELWGLVFVVAASLLIVATAWLRFFRIGPAEWLLRSVTYWRRPV